MGSKFDSRDVNAYKFAHSISFMQIDEKNIPKMINPKTAGLDRRSMFPTLVPDLSEDIIEEVRRRRTLHQDLLTSDKTAFRRKVLPESCVDYLLQKHVMRDLLPTMHPIRDEKSLCPPKTGFTYSRKNDNKRRELDSKIEDFLQPESIDSLRPRSTGFSRGHIRTMAGVDSFGPNHSKTLHEMRQLGALPLPHNADRNSPQASSVDRTSSRRLLTSLSSDSSISDDEETLGFMRDRAEKKSHQRKLSLSLARYSPVKPALSASPAQTKAASQSHTVEYAPAFNNKFRSLGSGGVAGLASVGSFSKSLSSVYNTSLRSGVMEASDKLLIDPKAKSLVWHEVYQQSLKDLEASNKEVEDMRRYREEQRRVAEETRTSLAHFEDKLKSMSRYS